MKDWCTGFPEYWMQWYLYKGFIPLTRVMYIGHCCRKHDDECRTKVFIDCMTNNNVVGSYLIVGISAIVCYFKYGKT